MIYDLSKKADLETVRFKLNKYHSEGKVIELKLKTRKKTIRQNKYVHVIINLFGIEFGYTRSEAKTLLKREFGNFMIYEKGKDKFLLSLADITKDQLQVFIEWVINYAASNDLYIPSSEEYLDNQYNIDRQIAEHQSRSNC